MREILEAIKEINKIDGESLFFDPDLKEDKI